MVVGNDPIMVVRRILRHSQIMESCQIFDCLIFAQSVMAFANGTGGSAFAGILQFASENGFREYQREQVDTIQQ